MSIREETNRNESEKRRRRIGGVKCPWKGGIVIETRKKYKKVKLYSTIVS